MHTQSNDLAPAESPDRVNVRAIYEETALARAVAVLLVGFRLENDLTQTEAGALLGFGRTQIARLESGLHTPTWGTVRRLVTALDVELVMNLAGLSIKPADLDEAKSEVRLCR